MFARRRQNAFQKTCLTAAVKAEDASAACALEMAVLVLSMPMLLAVTVMMFDSGTGVIAKDAIIAGDLVRQAGFGQAIQRAVKRDPVHPRKLILNILMRYRAACTEQRRHHIDARLSDAY